MARKIDGLSDKIIKATISVGAKSGALRVSTVEVAKKCKCSEMPIFKYFGTKNNLLKQAFLSIDRKMDKTFENVAVDPNQVIVSARMFWEKYLSFFLTHPTEAKYYASYRSSSLYDYETASEQISVLQNFTRLMLEFAPILKGKGFDDYAANVMWDFIISNTLAFAVRINDKKFPADDYSHDKIFSLIFAGIIQSM